MTPETLRVALHKHMEWINAPGLGMCEVDLRRALLEFGRVVISHLATWTADRTRLEAAEGTIALGRLEDLPRHLLTAHALAEKIENGEIKSPWADGVDDWMAFGKWLGSLE